MIVLHGFVAVSSGLEEIHFSSLDCFTPIALPTLYFLLLVNSLFIISSAAFRLLM